MKAVCWNGKRDMRVEQVPDPEILQPTDAIVRVTSTAICGSDLHLYNGYVMAMEPGDILGHEFMGEVVDVGAGVTKLKKGDRIVVPFPIACGRCLHCETQQWSLCDNTNPNAWMVEAMYGWSGAGIYGYSHLYGGFAGGQAQYARVPYADHGHIKVDESLTDEQVLFLSDILPTGWQAAERGSVAGGDVVAVWGAGPVGYFTVQSAYLQGAERVICIDSIPERLELVQRVCGAEIVNYEQTDDVIELLKQMTGGRGPDVCIDAVGLEAHGTDLLHFADKAKQTLRLEMDRPQVLRQVVQACRKGGTVSVIGVYAGFVDKFPMGAFFAKGLTMRAGQCDVQKYMPMLLERIRKGEIDTTSLVSHHMRIDDAPRAYELFAEKKDGCTKVVLMPHA